MIKKNENTNQAPASKERPRIKPPEIRQRPTMAPPRPARGPTGPGQSPARPQRHDGGGGGGSKQERDARREFKHGPGARVGASAPAHNPRWAPSPSSPATRTRNQIPKRCASCRSAASKRSAAIARSSSTRTRSSSSTWGSSSPRTKRRASITSSRTWSISKRKSRTSPASF